MTITKNQYLINPFLPFIFMEIYFKCNIDMLILLLYECLFFNDLYECLNRKY